MTEDIFYRYNDWHDSDGTAYLSIMEFPVIRYTPKGAWIDLNMGIYKEKPKFVLLSANKRYACPTREEALESFYARKRRQIKILTAQLERAKAALEATPTKSKSYRAVSGLFGLTR